MQEMKVDMLERANQMVSLCRNAATTANETVITLADQREQLEDIETGLISIDATLIDTKHNINRLKGITQRVIGTFRTKFHKKIVSKLMIHSTRKQSSASTPPRRRQLLPNVIQHNIAPSNSFLDKQIDDALYEIDNILHSLKNQAYVINDQLIGQADILNHIHQHMGKSADHIDEQNTDIKKLNLPN